MPDLCTVRFLRKQLLRSRGANPFMGISSYGCSSQKIRYQNSASLLRCCNRRRVCYIIFRLLRVQLARRRALQSCGSRPGEETKRASIFRSLARSPSFSPSLPLPLSLVSLVIYRYTHSVTSITARYQYKRFVRVFHCIVTFP